MVTEPVWTQTDLKIRFNLQHYNTWSSTSWILCDTLSLTAPCRAGRRVARPVTVCRGRRCPGAAPVAGSLVRTEPTPRRRSSAGRCCRVKKNSVSSATPQRLQRKKENNKRLQYFCVEGAHWQAEGRRGESKSAAIYNVTTWCAFWKYPTITHWTFGRSGQTNKNFSRSIYQP